MSEKQPTLDELVTSLDALRPALTQAATVTWHTPQTLQPIIDYYKQLHPLWKYYQQHPEARAALVD
jgi:hypothetical protein